MRLYILVIFSLLSTATKIIVNMIFMQFVGALQGIFSQIINGGEDQIREKAIKFLSLKLKLMGEDLVTSKIEEFVIEESKKVVLSL